MSRLRTSMPSTYLIHDQNLRSNLRNGMLLTNHQRENLQHVPANLHFANRINFLGNVAPISQNSTRSQQILTPTWFSQDNIVNRCIGRMPDNISRNETQEQVCYFPIHLGAYTTAEEVELSIGGGNVRSSQITFTPGLTIRAERQTTKPVVILK